VRVRVAAVLAASLLARAAGAQTPAEPACVPATEVAVRHLAGLWRARFEGATGTATLLLEPHSERADALRGAILRDGQRAWVAAEIEDGEFSLEESVNGINITAVWMGDVLEGSCGREIRGSWKADGDARQVQFVLRKE